MENVTGILIAGGKSTRMGENKALLPFGGIPLAAHMAKLLGSVCPQVIAIVNDDAIKSVLDVPCYSDAIEGVGPLGGLHAACRYSPTERFLTVPCDTPMVTPDLLGYLLQFYRFGNIIVPYSQGRMHPLIGLYARTLESRVERAIQRGVRSMHEFLDGQYPVIVDVDASECGKAHLLENLNTKEEYARCAAHAAPSRTPVTRGRRNLYI